MPAHLLPTERCWQCPSCGHQHTTNTAQVVTPLHACPHWAGLAVALVEVHSNHDDTPKVRHRLIMREDYVGREQGIVWGPGGAPISAVHTERADGSHDTHVFAPVAGISVNQ